MKRTFSAKRNLFSFIRLSFGAYAIILALVILAARFFAPNFFWHVAAPSFGISGALSSRVHAFVGSFKDASALARENETLKEQNAALALENRTLQKERSDRAALPEEGVIAGVIARPPLSPYDTLVVSAGAHAGIHEGMAAFGAGGVPLGIVSSVLPDFARITFFSAPEMAVNGWAGEDNVPITLQGAGGGALKAAVPRSAAIAEGDAVFVPGPGAVPIGVVARIDSDPSSPSVVLRVAPAFNLFSITQVVLKESGASLQNAFATSTELVP